MAWHAVKYALGLSEGGGLRGAIDQLKSSLGLDEPRGERSASSSIAFTIAVVGLSAKMSKADGVSTEVEAHAFEQQFAVPDREMANVRRLYALASQDVAGFETYAESIARLLADDADLKTSVLECLFHIATADGVLHPAEDTYLAEVAKILGFSDCAFRCIRRAFVVDPDSPYEVLDVAPDASDPDIKSRYRELVKQHHPDALVAKGVPPEFLAAAERRLAAITSAYEAVLIDRGQRTARELERST
ncbi:MAG: DnaJ family molecular chaperone [Hyphomicrobium sp.]|nr:DnaJ family molecular chaperone [Hyphomicrobium sp.]